MTVAGKKLCIAWTYLRNVKVKVKRLASASNVAMSSMCFLGRSTFAFTAQIPKRNRTTAGLLPTILARVKAGIKTKIECYRFYINCYTTWKFNINYFKLLAGICDQSDTKMYILSFTANATLSLRKLTHAIFSAVKIENSPEKV